MPPPRQSVPQALVRLHPARRVETPHEAALRRARRREAEVAWATAFEEVAETTRLWRPPDPPKYAPNDGGCACCGHLVRVHESGYNGRRGECKAIDCFCAGFRRAWTAWRVFAYALAVAVLASLTVYAFVVMAGRP